jgi:hypothetical protein
MQKHTMESILRNVSLEPMEITYLGIGSSPHLSADQRLDPKYDQLIPSCFHEFLVRDKKYMRILHFDPHFRNCLEFLNQYFEKWNLVPLEFSDGYSWVGEHMEVIVIPRDISHKDHSWFFEQLCETILQTRGKLVIQEYTGYELDSLNKQLYESSSNKELFKRRILLDMTYGTDTGCCTDMTKAQPFYDFDFNFLNLHFMTDEDAKRWAHTSLKLDEVIRKKYQYKYLSSLNSMHVDYRRKLKGESLMYGSSLYTEASTADEIMQSLQKELRNALEILISIRYVDHDVLAIFKDLCANYKSYDPYKWYDLVNKLLPRP